LWQARPLLIHALETGELGELVDTRLEKHYVESELFRMVETAAACVRHLAPKRPRMMQVMMNMPLVKLFFLISNLVRNILFRWRTKMSTIPV
jgi:hypothetical protein